MSTPGSEESVDESVIEAYGYVISSDYRKQVLSALDGAGPMGMRPVSISTEAGIEMPHVSRALKQLREKGIVELLVDDSVQKGRLYGLTGRGETVVSHIQATGESA